MKKLTLVLLSICFVNMLNGQINKPTPSPRVKTEYQVGLVNVSLDYGQPGVKGRTIYGALIPYGKVWRTGANSSTKISFSGDVELGGNELPAGDYALYSIPGKQEWTIIIYGNPKLWGAGNYDEENEVFRFKVKPAATSDFHETFSLGFENYNANGGDMIITWEKTKVSIPVFVDTDDLIFKEIDTKLVNATGEISAGTYFDAALFYYEKNKDLKKALSWLNEAVKLRPEAFWMVYYQAEIALKLDQTEKAESFARSSLQLAKASKAGDYGYIAKNELLLKQIAAAK